MLTYNEALDILKQVAQRKKNEAEFVALEESDTRILAQDIFATENLPVRSNSAMDGFLVQAPVKSTRLELQGFVAAGDEPISAEPGGAIEIMTGAPLVFTGSEAVVRLEDVQRLNHQIELQVAPKVGDNIRLAGSDVEVGQKVLLAGQKINPEQIMLLAALGMAQVPVVKKLKIALISTGNEICNGQIRNSTGPYLIASLKRLGLEVFNLGVCPDKPELFDSLLTKALDSGVDLIISTGAVSVGAFDFVLGVLKKRKAHIYFHKAAIRPGKPILCAQLGDAIFFGMPGNPMASAVGLNFFLRPYLFETKPVMAQLIRDTPKPKGLRAFYQATLSGTQVDIFQKQASYCMAGFALANAWAVLPEEGEVMPAGSMLEVYPL